MKNIFQMIKRWLVGHSIENDMTATNILQKIKPTDSPRKLAKDISQHFHNKEERKARLLKTVRGTILKQREEKLKMHSATSEQLIPQLSLTILSHPSAILKIGPTDEPSEKPSEEASFSDLNTPFGGMQPSEAKQTDEEGKS